MTVILHSRIRGAAARARGCGRSADPELRAPRSRRRDCGHFVPALAQLGPNKRVFELVKVVTASPAHAPETELDMPKTMSAVAVVACGLDAMATYQAACRRAIQRQLDVRAAAQLHRDIEQG